jgi:hypothetical protein
MTQTNPEIAGSTRFFSSLLGIWMDVKIKELGKKGFVSL